MAEVVGMTPKNWYDQNGRQTNLLVAYYVYDVQTFMILIVLHLNTLSVA
jgi:hypothetical protein